jgi:aspartyl-tRNA(Asn)/glutamyl-tRNA(Gln) amidotransferase subunit A
MNDICELSVVELARLIGKAEVSPVQAVEAVLARIEACEWANAFVCTSAEQALEAAATASKALAKGGDQPPLLGVPFSVKDVTHCRGVPTRNGSKALPPAHPEADHLAVARARAAGAILIGKTTTPELAHKAHTFSPLTGLTLNPYDAEVTCGGSSGGAAVAVALGMGPWALGTDGGGSVRIPAACCGVVGFKPSIGSLPDAQAQDLFGVTSHVGPLARRVADVRFVYEVLKGGHSHDPYGQAIPPALRAFESLKGVRVAWMRRCGNQELDHEVDRLCTDTIRRMENLGAIVEEVNIDFAGLEPHFLVLMESRVTRSLRGLDEAQLAQMDPSLRVHFDEGSTHSSVDYLDAMAARASAFRAVQGVLGSFDLIASPTMSAPPLPISQDPHAPVVINGRPTGRVRAEWYPYTLGFNLTGHPAISIPCGYNGSGLPIGFQLAARWFDEAFLLDAAELMESDLAFKPAPRSTVS